MIRPSIMVPIEGLTGQRLIRQGGDLVGVTRQLIQRGVKLFHTQLLCRDMPRRGLNLVSDQVLHVDFRRQPTRLRLSSEFLRDVDRDPHDFKGRK